MITQEDCKILVTGTYKNCSIPYNQTITLNVVFKNSTNNDSVIADSCIVKHTGIDESIFNNLKDGWYTIYHFTIPTIEWLNLNKDDLRVLHKYDNIIVNSGNSILKYNFRSEDFDNLNINDIFAYSKNSTISIEQEDTFLTCILKSCIDDLISDYTNTSCIKENKSDFNMKTAIMIYEMIQYYIHCIDYEEAQKLLEEFNNCFKFCQNKLCECLES